MLAKQGEGAQGEDEDDVSLLYLYCMYYLYNYGLLYGQVCRNISQGKQIGSFQEVKLSLCILVPAHGH